MLTAARAHERRIAVKFSDAVTEFRSLPDIRHKTVAPGCGRRIALTETFAEVLQGEIMGAARLDVPLHVRAGPRSTQTPL